MIDNYINRLKVRGRQDIGDIQTNSKGVRYSYNYYIIDNPGRYDLREFEKVRNKIYGIFGMGNVYNYKEIRHSNCTIIITLDRRGNHLIRITLVELVKH